MTRWKGWKKKGLGGLEITNWETIGIQEPTQWHRMSENLGRRVDGQEKSGACRLSAGFPMGIPNRRGRQ